MDRVFLAHVLLKYSELLQFKIIFLSFNLRNCKNILSYMITQCQIFIGNHGIGVPKRAENSCLKHTVYNTCITSFTMPLSADIFAFFRTETFVPIHVMNTNFDRLLSSSPLITRR